MISLASETHSLHSAVPARPSSFWTSCSRLPHHEHASVAYQPAQAKKKSRIAKRAADRKTRLGATTKKSSKKSAAT